MVDIQSVMAKIKRGKRIERRKKEDKNIMSASATHGGHNYNMIVVAETEEDLIKRLNEWKNNVLNGGMRVNMNKTKEMLM